MPFDGVVAKCVVKELSSILVGSRVEKIFQPEPDEIIINIRAKGQNLKLLLSASANYPRIHITDTSKENPAAPPVFCMLLRKHLSGGKIIGIDFHDFERIITIRFESIDELGDLNYKKLVIEIMGRHSNIIFVNHEDKIIDSIKHVDNEISSVREVMPARPYVFPPAQDKTSPSCLNADQLIHEAEDEPGTSVEKFLLNKIKGFSPLLCREICSRSGLESKAPVASISNESLNKLKLEIIKILNKINSEDFSPCIIYSDNKLEKPVDFHCLQITQTPFTVHMESISRALDIFYSTKDRVERFKQKTSDLQKVLNTSLSRCGKKLALHEEKLREVSDREKLKLFGELITANIYCIPKGVKTVSLLNYYSENNEYISISMDENLTPQENAQRYFKQYAKAKSTFTAATRQLGEDIKELEYLESVNHLLNNCITIQEIEEIRQELIEQGYMSSRKKSRSKRQEKPTAPIRFKSTDGLDIFVGKNNRQNDYLTLKMASSNDIWLHTRNIPGSHVVIKKQQYAVPDNTLFEAAMLAAFHSKAGKSSNVPVDYTTVRNVKKPGGAKPGMVIYENFKTIIVTPDESLANKLKVSK